MSDLPSKTKVLTTAVHGSGHPEKIIEKILRMKIYDNPFWKEHCYALTAKYKL